MTTTLSARMRNSLHYRTGLWLPRSYPKTAAELQKSDLYNQWWYYSVELLPGVVTRGCYPPDLPMLPRIMLRECHLEGADCLDLGSMEGMIPVLMSRGGARSVLATDAVAHCVEKMEAVKHYHGVSFKYRSIGLMYELHNKLEGAFDVINCSGLLYHVMSPLTVLFGMRPLLKRGGLAIVSTNVTVEDGMSMQFNNAGRMQAEQNTFWYPTARLLDYWLRYLKLAPLKALFVPHEAVRIDGYRCVFDKPSGYVSVLCRAVDKQLPEKGDEWMTGSATSSWEYSGLSDWERAATNPEAVSGGPVPDARFVRDSGLCIDLHRAIVEGQPLVQDANEEDTHLLRLGDVN